MQHRGGFYYVRLSSGGKKRFVALETKTLEVARTRCAEKTFENEKTRKAARNADMGVVTMGALLTLQRKAIAEREEITEGTRELNLQTCNFIETTWPGFADLRPADIKPESVQAWRDRALSTGTGYKPPGVTKLSPKTAGRSASSFNKAVDMLRRLLDLAVDKDVIYGNKLAGRRGLKAKDKPHKPRLPDAPVLHALFAEIESVGGKGVPAAELCRLLAFTGCRLKEAASLRWQDIDCPKGFLKVRGTKTDSADREVPIIPAARDLLVKMRTRREERAEIAVDGKPHVDPASSVLIVREAQKSLTRACAKLGVERLTHHDLRDAFATTAIESGVDVPTVAAWLGHADGGALLMRVYQHHRRPHSVAQAAKVDFGGTS